MIHLNIVEMLLDPGNPNRPGKSYTRRNGEVVTWQGVHSIVSHRTGNARPDADARAHYRYFNGGDRSASAHYFVDGKEIVRIIPEDEIAFHAYPVNADTIGIELTEAGGDWQSGYPAYVELHADICLRYGLDPLKDIRGHYKIDPINRPADPIGLFKWEPFLQDVKRKYDEVKAAQPVNITEALGSPTSPPKNEGNTIPFTDGLTPIIGLPVASAGQLRQLLLKRNPDAPDYAQLFLDIGAKYGIRGDVGFCQSVHETGAWKFGGQVKPDQNNFAGLGAVNGGGEGARFATPAEGIEAQTQHLYLYATTAELPPGTTLIDPRWDAAVGKWGRGAAPNVEDLAGKWAVPGYDPKRYGSYAEAFTVGATYGQSILKLLNEALTYPAEPGPAPKPEPPVEDPRIALLLAENAKLKDTIARAIKVLAEE